MIILDTHVIIWDALSPEKISEKAKESISHANQGDGIFLCDICLWEIAMLMKKKRINVETSYQSFIRLILDSNKYIIHGITAEVAELSVNFPKTINKDPADRIIAATSIHNNAPLLTADENLIKAPEITTIW